MSNVIGVSPTTASCLHVKQTQTIIGFHLNTFYFSSDSRIVSDASVHNMNPY